jgi:hypothetical protein
MSVGLWVRTASGHRLPRQLSNHHRLLHRSRTVRNVSQSPSQASPGSAKPSGRRFGGYVAGAALALTGYALGSFYPPDLVTLLFPRPAPPPLDPASEEAMAYTIALEKEMLSLPTLKEHRNRPDAEDWYEIRPFGNIPEERRINHLTSGALRAPGKLAVAPVCRIKKDESEALIILHVGRALCGHDGIIHGGMLATLLDESMGRTVRYFCFILRAAVSRGNDRLFQIYLTRSV